MTALDLDIEAGRKMQDAMRRRDAAPALSGAISATTETAQCVDCDRTFPAHVLFCGETRLFGMVRCTECCERGMARLFPATATASVPKPDPRTAAWEAICPPEYRESDMERLRAVVRQGEVSRLDGAGKMIAVAPDTAVDEILAWDAAKRGLGLVGVPGRCKTRLMYAMLRGYVLGGGQARAIHGAALSRKMAAAYEAGAAAAEAWLREWIEIPVLLIDDVDKARFTDAVLTDFYWLVEERQAFRRPTCFTANANGKMIAERLRADAGRKGTQDSIGESIVRRLRAMADSYTI